ncbi:four helix bundle protein [Arachidicoccus ginsenosidimutans]|uniref:four helix bundle protein n=1 Tax=Arachidicoccus sp. BS20 TaxID=1850526 RepID=UPI0007F0DE2B|nr:four helix bundle protein [Arachidicoccus sp. BS20]ANI89578.1 four helix bundle protein [Arachidicoccus sp. BS20]
MKDDNIILDKSFLFALRITKLFLHLRKNKVERELCVQLLKSGTSVGANVEEAVGGSSRKDFIHKLEIAYREARETRYWLRILKETKFIEEKIADSFINDCEEIIKILTSIINSSKG